MGDRLRAYARGETQGGRPPRWNPGRDLLAAGFVAQSRIFLAPPSAPPAAPPGPAPSPSPPSAAPPAADTFSRRVDLLLARGDVAAASEVVSRWRRAHPGDPAAQAHARVLLHELRAKERAKRGAPLLALSDDTLPLLLRDALRGSDTPAIRALANRWRAARPSSAESWALIGLSFRRLGDEASARAAWRRSLEIDPEQRDLAALVEGEW